MPVEDWRNVGQALLTQAIATLIEIAVEGQVDRSAPGMVAYRDLGAADEARAQHAGSAETLVNVRSRDADLTHDLGQGSHCLVETRNAERAY